MTSNLRTSDPPLARQVQSLSMCSSCRSNKNPQDSEADIHIIGSPLVDRHANDRRRNDQTARISLHHPSMSKSVQSKEKRQTDPTTLGQPEPPFRLLSAFAAGSGGFLRPRRFGEAVSSHDPRQPQEEKSHPVTILSSAHVLLAFSRHCLLHGLWITLAWPWVTLFPGRIAPRLPCGISGITPPVPRPVRPRPQKACGRRKYR